MAKIDAKIVKDIKDGNYEDVHRKTSHDTNAKHTHVYPEQIREIVAEYEKEAGYVAKADKLAHKKLEELTRKSKNKRITKKINAGKSFKKQIKDSATSKSEELDIESIEFDK